MLTYVCCLVFLQSRCTRNDFDKFSRDDGLSCTIEGEREFINHLASIFTCTVHGRHPWRLFWTSILLHCVIDEGRQRVLNIALNHIRIQWIVNTQLRGCADRIDTENRNFRCCVRDDWFELVVHNLPNVELITAAQNRFGDTGCILKFNETIIKVLLSGFAAISHDRVVWEISNLISWNLTANFLCYKEDVLCKDTLKNRPCLVTDAHNLRVGCWVLQFILRDKIQKRLTIKLVQHSGSSITM